LKERNSHGPARSALDTGRTSRAKAAIPFRITAVITFQDLGNGKTAYKAVSLHKNEADREAHEKMGFHEGWGTVAGQLEEYAQGLKVSA
jgi:uncharacterized protein YndB with AHSA1/START domain